MDCKETPAETRELILEGLRARKAKRAAKAVKAGTSYVPDARKPILLAEKQSKPEGLDADDEARSPEEASD